MASPYLSMKIILHQLAGNDKTGMVLQRAVGKEISELKLDDDVLCFSFADGTKIRVWDDGQSCCEYRYMTTDDDLSYHVGAKLMGFEERDAPEIDTAEGVHEVQFLLVTTSKGVFTMETHNEHNGYYGGFEVQAVETE
jgi:hypothetical protein